MPKIENIPCVILSGGKSSRMGRDKSMLPFGSENSLIKYQYIKFSKIFKNIYISSKENKFDFPCQIIYDENDIFSPMVALQSILNKFNNQKVFIVSVDTPLVLESSIVDLIENKDNAEVVICADEFKVHNLCGIFSSDILPKIDQMLENNNHKINYLLTQLVDLRIVYFENSHQFSNINTQEEYDELIVL